MNAPAAPPEVAIIGAMKCGTTTLHRYLAQHHSVVEGHTKEIDFFCTEANFARGTEWYHASFSGWKPGQLRLDSSPNYTKRHNSPQTAARLAEANPSARLVYLVREPISRLRSHYLHGVAHGRETHSIDDVLSDHQNHMIQTTRYAWQLAPFRALFPDSQILVVRFDDLVSDTLGTVNRTLGFLGLGPLSDLAGVDQHSTADKTMPSALARSMPFGRGRGLLRKISPKLADRPLPDAMVSEDIAAAVRTHLRDDLTELHDTGLVDISDWLA